MCVGGGGGGERKEVGSGKQGGRGEGEESAVSFGPDGARSNAIIRWMINISWSSRELSYNSPPPPCGLCPYNCNKFYLLNELGSVHASHPRGQPFVRPN